MDNGGEVHIFRFRQLAAAMNEETDTVLNQILHVLFQPAPRNGTKPMFLNIQFNILEQLVHS
ncbi:hypothetical protein CHH75_11505 [Paenibacillus sp. 7541]|nr:hypothetical protein CHH75_11505 [Paenibacillus sp. 7541]